MGTLRVRRPRAALGGADAIEHRETDARRMTSGRRSCGAADALGAVVRDLDRITAWRKSSATPCRAAVIIDQEDPLRSRVRPLPSTTSSASTALTASAAGNGPGWPVKTRPPADESGLETVR